MNDNDIQQSGEATVPEEAVLLQAPPAALANDKIRFSGVELLRILAILLICINHAVQTSQLFIDFDNVLSVGAAFLRIMRYFGQMGNILFVICSAYFLVDSKRMKGEKALGLLFDSALISIIIFIGFLICGFKFSAMEILRQFVPDLWFIPAYVLFYVIHPLLNGAVRSMSRKSHFTFVLVCFILGAVEMFVSISGSLLNTLVGFIIVYFTVAYMKKYMQSFCESTKANAIVFCVFFGAFLLCAVLKYVFGMKSAYVKSGIVIDGFYSPLLLPALLSLFNLFNKMKFKNRVINYFASCSLFVYCFHENPLLRSIARPAFYRYFFGLNADLYFVWVLMCSFGMFLGAYIISVVYKETLHRLMAFLSKKLSELFAKIIDFFYKKTVDNGDIATVSDGESDK